MTSTQLPPNLTRHFYETRRGFLASAGAQSTPWYQLTAMERVVVESEVEIFRKAILRAEEERDLLASLKPPTAAPAAAAAEPAAAVAEPAPAGEEPPIATDPENCVCLGCSAVAALLKLLSERLEAPAGTGGDISLENATTVEYRVLPLQDRHSLLSAEEKARIVKAARDIGKRDALGRSLQDLELQVPGGVWTFDTAPVRIEALVPQSSPFDEIRTEVWIEAPFTASKA